MGLEHIDLSKFRRAGAPSTATNDSGTTVGPDLSATLGFIDEQTGQLEEQKRQKEAQERKKPYRPASMGDFFDQTDQQMGQLEQNGPSVRGEAIDQAAWTLRQERARLLERLEKHQNGDELMAAEEVRLVELRLEVMERELGDLARVAIAEGHMAGRTERERLLAVGGIGCQVCGHPDRLKVDAALLEGSYRVEQVARLFGVPRKALRDHLERHLLPVVEYSGALSRVAVGLRGIKETVGRLDHLAELGEKALQLAVEELGTIGENGKRGGSVKDVATMLDSLRQTIELRGRLKGELGAGAGGDGGREGNGAVGGSGDTVVRVGPRMAVMMVPSLPAQDGVQGAERAVRELGPTTIEATIEADVVEAVADVVADVVEETAAPGE